MPNHVLRDRIWESDKLKRCSREAALAYPWIFLVADDWGRFECNAVRICGRVFGGRHGVTVEEVASWLAEYEREGLLVRYHIDRELGFWTGFRGRPESQRRRSDYPDPYSFPEIKELLDYITEHHRPPTPGARRSPRKKVGRGVGRPEGKPFLDKEGDIETEVEGGAPTKAEPWTKAGGRIYESVNGVGTWDERRAIRFNAQVAPLVKEYGEARVLAVWGWYLQQPSEKPAFLTPENFRANFLLWEKRSRGAARASPKAQAKDDADATLIRAGLGGNRDGRSVDQGNGATRGVLPEPGGEPGAEGDTGQDVPGGAQPPVGRNLALRRAAGD